MWQAEDSGEKVIDEKLWRANCLDLKRVMSVAKSVFLLLEHSNEAVLRVGVELVTCPRAKKCLWWNDNWFSEDKKHDYFKQVVKEKLMLVLCGVKGVPPSQLEGPGEGSEEDVDTLRKELEEYKQKFQQAEAVAKSAQLQQKNAERELQNAQANDKVNELQRSLEQMRQKAKEAEESAQSAQKEAAAAKEAASKAEEKAVAAQRAAAAQPKAPGPAARDAKGGATPAEAASPNSGVAPAGGAASGAGASPEDKKRIAELERQLKRGQEEKEQMQKQLTEEKDKAARAEEKARRSEEDVQKAKNAAGRAKGTSEAEPETPKMTDTSSTSNQKQPISPSSSGNDPRLKDALNKLEDMKRKHQELKEAASDKEAELQDLQKKMGFAEKRANAAEKRVESMADRIQMLEEQLKAAGAEPPPAPAEVDKAPRQPKPRKAEDDAEITELRRKSALADSLQERLRKAQEENKELKEETARLEDLKTRMARALAQVRDQLQKMTQIAEKRGCGGLIAEIMGEAQVLDTINSEEYTCFARLWDDAMRRQKKHKTQDRTRFGDDEDKPKQHFLKRRRGSVTGDQDGGGFGAAGGSDYFSEDDEFPADRSGSPMQSEDPDSHGTATGSRGGSGQYKVGYKDGYRDGYEAALNSDGSRPGTGRRPQQRNEGSGLFIVGHSANAQVDFAPNTPERGMHDSRPRSHNPEDGADGYTPYMSRRHSVSITAGHDLTAARRQSIHGGGFVAGGGFNGSGGALHGFGGSGGGDEHGMRPKSGAGAAGLRRSMTTSAIPLLEEDGRMASGAAPFRERGSLGGGELPYHLSRPGSKANDPHTSMTMQRSPSRPSSKAGLAGLSSPHGSSAPALGGSELGGSPLGSSAPAMVISHTASVQHQSSSGPDDPRPPATTAAPHAGGGDPRPPGSSPAPLAGGGMASTQPAGFSRQQRGSATSGNSVDFADLPNQRHSLQSQQPQRPKTHAGLTHSRSAPGELPHIGAELGMRHSPSRHGPRMLTGTGKETGILANFQDQELNVSNNGTHYAVPRGCMLVSSDKGGGQRGHSPGRDFSPRLMWRPKKPNIHTVVPFPGGGKSAPGADMGVFQAAAAGGSFL